jgi:hypothetical protein
MVYTLADLEADVQSYTQYDDPGFVAMIPSFIREAEERIWYFVQLPFFRKNVTGAFTAGNKYLQLPDDFLAPASLAVIVLNEYTYLLNKDVNYMREVYPDPTVTGVPKFYALFSADADDTTIIVAPTPAQNYATELHYFYKPASLTAGASSGTTWLSENAYDTLLYGTLEEAANWMKRTSGIDGMADTYGQRFLIGLQGLKNLGEARDRKDVYRSGEKRSPEQ